MKLLLLAVAPAMVIMLYIYFKDTFEKEPIKLLLKNFFLGATLSILLTFVLGFFVGSVLPVTDSQSIWQMAIKAFITVALVEEFSKFVIVQRFAQNREEYNEPFDGIVYAVMVSMGFATLENILYVFQYGFGTGVFRAFTSVPAHATFAILMGYFMGKAKFSDRKWRLNMMGLLIATLFHGAYDFFLFINFVPGIAIGAFISLLIGLYFSRIAMKRHQKRSQFRP